MDSKKSKYIYIILTVLCIMMIALSSVKGGLADPIRNTIGYILVPVQTGVNRVGFGIYRHLKNHETLQEAEAAKQTLQEQVDTLTAESAELTAKLESAQSDYDALKAKYNTMSDKMGWVDTYVVYVENDGTNYYHCYECSSFKKQSFWVYNRKLAENKGFTACPVCGG